MEGTFILQKHFQRSLKKHFGLFSHIKYGLGTLCGHKHVICQFAINLALKSFRDQKIWNDGDIRHMLCDCAQYIRLGFVSKTFQKDCLNGFSL